MHGQRGRLLGYVPCGGLLVVVILQLVHHKLTDRTPKRLTPEESKARRLALLHRAGNTGDSYLLCRYLSSVAFLLLSSFSPLRFGCAFSLIFPCMVCSSHFGGLGIKEKQARGTGSATDKLERQKKSRGGRPIAQSGRRSPQVLEAEASFPDVNATSPNILTGLTLLTPLKH